MPDLLAGSTVEAGDTPVTVSDTETGQYTFTNTSYGTGTTGGSYSDCGVAFVAPTTGRVIIHLAANLLTNSGAGPTALVAPVVRNGSVVGSGTTVLAATDDNSVAVGGTMPMRYGASVLVTGLTDGNSYNVRLEHRVSSAIVGTALRRHVVVQGVS